MDVPAGALEPPTNRTELGLLQEEGLGMPCSFAGLASTCQGPAPCSAHLVFTQSPPCPDPQSACLWNGYNHCSCVSGLS